MAEESIEHSLQRKIGILTGGGDCPGLNAVIRGAVHRLIRHYQIRPVGIEDAFNGLMESPTRLKVLNLGNVSGILSMGGTILGTTNHGDPFGFPVQQKDGTIQLTDLSEKLKKNFDLSGLEGLICIGGDGTLSIAERLSREHQIPMVGVPKTIDNDVSQTDWTFGHHTAVQTATNCIDMLHSTAEAHDRIMVVEVMGRDAGHIAVAAGLAGGADVILIPEIPFQWEPVVQKIKRRKQYGRHFSIVVVAEGAKTQDGSSITQTLSPEQQAGRKVKLGGIGQWVAEKLSAATEMETRVTVLGHLQRGGSPTAFDRMLATAFGAKAADLAANGDWGRMVALKTPQVVSVPLLESIRTPRPVEPSSAWIQAARSVGISFGDAPTIVA
ncbi:MAG: 6-phosphofructokinase [Myxococcales bacterium]|nr:6-phosphofructokinase [Myxococcales bacterium]|tara:strand:+ start:3369 stop:4517 length:1149 start_codon:yes stop_codon:yes gene_type:complete